MLDPCTPRFRLMYFTTKLFTFRLLRIFGSHPVSVYCIFDCAGYIQILSRHWLYLYDNDQILTLDHKSMYIRGYLGCNVRYEM